MRRTLTVILASDVAGYSRLVAAREEQTIERFRAAATVFVDLVKKYHGTVFNTAGDAILAKFDSAVDATRCAIDIQDANNASNAEIPDEEKLLFRIGIAIGDVLVAENGDLLGDAVNIAARLEGVAEPGGICISADVRAQVLNKIRLNVIDLGDQSLRNLPHAIRVYKLAAQLQDHVERRQRSVRSAVAGIPFALLASVVAIAVVLGLAVLGWHYGLWSRDSTTALETFDPLKVPLITDRVRETLTTYEHEAEFKAVAISREGWGITQGAVDLESAKRESLDRCRQRDEKGYCRIYAVGNKVVMSKLPMPLPADVHAAPLQTAFTDKDGELLGQLIPKSHIETYFKLPNHKGIAISTNGFWSSGNRRSEAEAADSRSNDAPTFRSHRVSCLRSMDS